MDGDMVTITRAEYEDLIDLRDHAAETRDIASGAAELLSETEVDAYVAAPTALAFWRSHRGLAQAELAEKGGLSLPVLVAAEAGLGELPAQAYHRLAKALRVRIEDILPEG